MLLFIGSPEIIFILLIIVLLFGSKRLPEIVKTMSKGMNEIKKAANDIKKEINLDDNEIVDNIKDIQNSVKNIKDFENNDLNNLTK